MKFKFAMGLLATTFLLTVCRENFGQKGDLSTAKAADANSEAPSKPIDTGLHVLTCGHSFHSFFITPILKNMADRAGIKGHEIVGVSKIPGSKAIAHWEVPDAKNEAKAALREGKVDVLTLTCMLQPDEGIEKFATLGLEHNPNFRVSLQESWLPWDKFEWPLKGSEDVIDFNAATFPNLREKHEPYFKGMDDYVVELNKKLGKQVVFVAPCGQALLSLREKIIAGQAPGLAKQSDLFTDKNGHPHPPLEALVGYVHFGVLYRRSPVGLPLPEVLAKTKKPEWGDKLNRLLQELAWDAVIHQPLSGVTEKN